MENINLFSYKYKQLFGSNDNKIVLGYTYPGEVIFDEWIAKFWDFLECGGCLDATDLKPQETDDLWFVYEDLIYIIPERDIKKLMEGEEIYIESLEKDVYDFTYYNQNDSKIKDWLDWYSDMTHYF
jgi:hypothetical protein